MKKSFTAVVLAIAMILALAGCSGSSGSAPNANIPITETTDAAPSVTGSSDAGYSPVDDAIHAFGGGSSGGGYYTISSVLSQFFNDNNLGTFTAQATTGGSQNGLLMQEGSLDIAVINGANCMEAYTGSTKNFSEPYQNLRAVAVLYSGSFQMLVANDDSIKGMNDLKGRKVGIGGPGSGDNGHAERIFTACGFGVPGVNAQYIGVTESTDQLKDGQISGFVNVASVPYSVATELTMSKKAKLIGLEADVISALTTKDDSVYFATTIPAGSYEGQSEDIQTVALPTVLCVDAERISDELAYNITKIIYENVDELKGLYAGFDIDPKASVEAMKIPVHDGAVKYYKELGLM